MNTHAASGRPLFPSGDGTRGGDFVARFAVDSPELQIDHRSVSHSEETITIPLPLFSNTWSFITPAGTLYRWSGARPGAGLPRRK